MAMPTHECRSCSTPDVVARLEGLKELVEVRFDEGARRFEDLKTTLTDHESRIRTVETAAHRLSAVWAICAAFGGAVLTAGWEWLHGGRV